MAKNVVPPRSGTLGRFFSWKGIGETWSNAWKIAAYPGATSILSPLYWVVTGSAALAYGTVSTAVQLTGMTCAGVWNGGAAIVNKLSGKSSSAKKPAPRPEAGKLTPGLFDGGMNFGEVAVRDQIGRIETMVDVSTGTAHTASPEDIAQENLREATLEARRANGGKDPAQKGGGLWSSLTKPAEVTGVTIDRAAIARANTPRSSCQPTFFQRLSALWRDRS